MERLSPRQLAIVPLVCDDELTNPGVARVLGISHNTVKNHMTVIYRLMEVQTRSGMCREYGKQQGKPVNALRADAV